MKKTYYVIFLILPVLLGIVAGYLNEARGPYWLGTNLDPEYVYLLNADNLAGMRGVGHIDHPGTPVQVLGAVVLRAVHLVKGGSDDLHTDVLKRPELYLNAINSVLIGLNMLGMALLGIAVFRWTQHLWGSLWLQFAPFLSIVMLQSGLTRVTPEPLLFFAGMAFVAALVFFIKKNEDAGKSGSPVSLKQMVLIFGVVTGFGIACKVTFLPLIVIPIILIKGIKRKIAYVLATVAGFVLFTLPIVRMYDRFFNWLYLLLSHSGHYGGGAAGLISAGKFIDHLKMLLAHNLFFSTVLVFGSLLIGVVMVIPRLRKEAFGSNYFKLLAAGVIAMAGGLGMVAKHAADHYLLPVMSLSGIVVWAAYKYIKNLVEIFDWRRKLLPEVSVILFISIIILFNPILQFKSRAEMLRGMRDSAMEVHREVVSNYSGYAKIYYYTGSSPEYALKFGDDISRSYHSDALEKIYKDVYFYDIWASRFTRFNINKEIKFEKIEAKYGDKIVFQGVKGLKIPGMKLWRVSDSKYSEGIFVIR